MEKQSLIKYYCALFLMLILLAGSNNAVAETPSPTSSLTPKVTTTQSPQTTESRENPKVDDNSMWFPIILSILALVASGGVIALTILKNKEINDKIQSNNEKYNTKLRSLEDKYTELLTSRKNLPLNRQGDTYARNSENYSDTNPYLDKSIDDLSVRITELEDKLNPTPIHQQSIISSSSAYLSNQSRSREPEIDPFNQADNLYQSEATQILENKTYIGLVNTYNTNPKLLDQKAIKVSEDKDSITRRHTDSSQKIVLKQINNGNYWVIHDDVDVNCWLLPKINLRINQYSYETTKALFECHGYQLEHYNKFKLIKPAKVILLSSEEQTWQINELGILEFTVED
jgi:hypothetical protein